MTFALDLWQFHSKRWDRILLTSSAAVAEKFLRFCIVPRSDRCGGSNWFRRYLFALSPVIGICRLTLVEAGSGGEGFSPVFVCDGLNIAVAPLRLNW